MGFITVTYSRFILKIDADADTSVFRRYSTPNTCKCLNAHILVKVIANLWTMNQIFSLIHEVLYNMYAYLQMHQYLHNCTDDNHNFHMYSVRGYQTKPRLIEIGADRRMISTITITKAPTMCQMVGMYKCLDQFPWLTPILKLYYQNINIHALHVFGAEYQCLLRSTSICVYFDISRL